MATITSIIGSIFAGLTVIGGFVWWFAKLYGKITTIEAHTTNVNEWVRDLRDGKGPVCAEHKTQLAAHEKKLDNHEGRISDLELGAAQASR